jgi:hypothetical protein
MDSPLTAAAGGALAAPESSSLIARTIAVFVRPAHAWNGLERHVQWWFPMLVVSLAVAAFSLVLHDRVMVPMSLSGMEQQVADGKMSAQQLEDAERFFSGPAGRAFLTVWTVIVTAAMTFIAALAMSFGVGFVLGAKLRYRLALEVAAWSSLVTIPTYILTAVIAWGRETLQGVHVGLGILMPEPETPTRLSEGLGAFLDALGPLSIWYLIVAILGASALSGAPRRSVAWVMSVIYLALAVFGAAMKSLSVPA